MIPGLLIYKDIEVIGAGGVASYLMPVLSKLVNTEVIEDVEPERIIRIWDGDTLEERNLIRQNFDPEQTGREKARILAIRYDCLYMVDYFHEHHDDILRKQVIYMVCVDNHAARRAVLNVVDRDDGIAIIGANSTTGFEAYIYRPEWRGGPCDPRTYYPEIVTTREEADDPLHRGTGCDSAQALAETPQLASANMQAAAAMISLFWAHMVDGFAMKDEFKKKLPLIIRGNPLHWETTTIEQKEKQ